MELGNLIQVLSGGLAMGAITSSSRLVSTSPTSPLIASTSGKATF